MLHSLVDSAIALSARCFVKFYVDFLVIVRLNTIFATSKIE